MNVDVAASIKARLLNQAKARREDFGRTLTRFAAERLLYRLGASPARERCLLKGASLLGVWLPDPYRATRDVDVLASGPSDAGTIRALLQDICAIPCPEDGIQFDLSKLTIGPIRPDQEEAGTRARFLAFLGTARITVQVDLGFGDAVVPEEIEYPTMLDRLPAPRLRAYPREASIAEKFEAMVKLGTQNSRMKDFHDLWALSTSFAFDGPRLCQAVAACFERRATPWTADAPAVLTPAFYLAAEPAARWSHYLASGAVLVLPPASFDVIGESIRRFLRPVRDQVVAEEPFAGMWPAGGPWSSTARPESETTRQP